MKTEEKSNEITAVPELLAKLELLGCIVTLDAMGCQRAIAKQVNEGGGDYVLALKTNQPDLEREVRGYFEPAMEEDIDRPEIQEVVRSEEGQGPVENKSYFLSTDLIASSGVGKVCWFEGDRNGGIGASSWGTGSVLSNATLLLPPMT